MNYIKRHWSGENSLAFAFWINLFLINIIMAGLQAWYTVKPPINDPVTYSRIGLLIFIPYFALIYPWQLVGTWRSCDRHVKETDKHLASAIVRLLIIIGALSTFASSTEIKTSLKSMFEIAFTEDRLADYTLSLSDDQTKLHFTGRMGFGASADIEGWLEQYPNIDGIILDSIGGRIGEGRAISNLIFKHALNTYTIEGCYSACVVAFVSGQYRAIATGANLGFHQYAPMNEEIARYVEMKVEQERDLAVFRKQKIDDSFIERIFQAENDDLWYPTINEMITAGVIHDVISPSAIARTNYGSVNRVVIEQEMARLPAVSTIKKYDPVTYDTILNELVKSMNEGQAPIEIQTAVGQYYMKLGEKALRTTSGEATVEFIKETITISQLLKQEAPILCMKYFYSDLYGELDITQHLTTEELLPLLKALGIVIEHSYTLPPQTINVKDGEKYLMMAAESLGDDIAYLSGEGLSNSAEYAQSCDAVAEFYGIILNYDKPIAENVARYVMSN